MTDCFDTAIISKLVAGRPLAPADIDELRTLALAGRLVVRRMTPEAQRRRRLAERDEAIRAYVRQQLTFLAPSVAAKTLAEQLAAPEGLKPEQVEALSSIIKLNDWKSLAWRQIFNILKGSRGR